MNMRTAILSTGILSPWLATSVPRARSWIHVGRQERSWSANRGPASPVQSTIFRRARRQRRVATQATAEGLPIDLRGKRAFIAGIADDQGFGWAIAKALCTAGADVSIGVWVPAMKIFETSLKRGKFDEARRLPNGEMMEFAHVYPMDAIYDTPEDVPSEVIVSLTAFLALLKHSFVYQVAENKRYAGADGYTVSEVAAKVQRDSGSIDILIHSLANAPEVTKPLLETSRNGYLAAMSASSYSYVSMLQRFGPLMPPGAAALSLSYVAAVQVVPGYGGGMSSAKAALESDTRVLAYEAGKKYKIRVNGISAGPLGSRAAKAIGFIDMIIAYSHANAPIQKELHAAEVGNVACFLCSPLASAITGQVIFVDNGLSVMSLALDSEIVQKEVREKGLD